MFGACSGDDQEVPPSRELFPVGPVDFPEPSPDQVPVYRSPESPADRKSGAPRHAVCGYKVSDDQEAVFNARAPPDHPEHGSAAFDAFPYRQPHPGHVLHRQTTAPFASPTLEDRSTAPALHSLPEAVGVPPLAPARLVGSLHSKSPVSAMYICYRRFTARPGNLRTAFPFCQAR
jgi:hypothetical protein